jgi:hypothetical protein
MDDQHGNFSFNKKFRKAYGLRRQFLHASRLSLEYGGKRQSWTSPLPADLARPSNVSLPAKRLRRNFGSSYAPVKRMPPSTGRIAAVTIDASSDAR